MCLLLGILYFCCRLSESPEVRERLERLVSESTKVISMLLASLVSVPLLFGFHGSICHAIGDLRFFLLTLFEAISMKIFLQKPGHARSDSAGSLRMASHVSNIINFEQAYNKVWL